MYELKTQVRVEEGLHTRPSTQFAKLAKSFKSDVEVIRDGLAANGKSAVKIMLLGVKQFEEVVIRASGEDEEQAILSLKLFLLDEEAGMASAAPTPALSATASASLSAAASASACAVPAISASRKDLPIAACKGIGASEGHRVANAFVYLPEVLKAPCLRLTAGAEEGEWQRFEQIFGQMRERLMEQLDASEEDRNIIESLLDVSADEEYHGAIRQRVLSGCDAASACLAVGDELAAALEGVNDPYIQARAEDVRGITRQLTLRLLGKEDVCLSELEQPCIVVAEDLSALDFARANLAQIRGIVCMHGSATSHVAIMARAHGIPAVLGLGVSLDSLRSVRQIALNGADGHVWFDPEDAVIERCQAAEHREQQQLQALQDFRHLTPTTRDGRVIEVAANLGTLKEIHAAIEAGAMGVGLFRTELLFMDRRSLPDEDEQTKVYTELAKAFAPHPVIIRTLDVGGDKPLPGIQFPQEENPFLGWRGLRMCLDRPDIFLPQLRALLRASVEGNIKIMFPMVSDVDELRRAKALLAECALALAAEGIVSGQPKVGIMIETPAAVLTAETLAAEVDFFSIGTNDLTQYVMAVDRMNARLAHLYRTDHPAVLNAIRMVCNAAEQHGIQVGVCGEAAAKPEMIPSLVALGVTELSMSSTSILRAKQVISSL